MYASVLVGLAVAIGAPKAKDPPKKEATIVGEWVGEKALAGGKELPVPDGGITFTFSADGGLTIKEGNRPKPEAGSYKANPKKDPPEIDLIPPPDKKEPQLQGIYKLDGDTLTLCFSRGGPGGERPKNFESPEGSQVIVMTLKRAKKD
ncbi:MAG TPA: TIGR03067 domain-containing protein [Gemmataceae bacterium]|nr:TIGR03067 domain-containing protein [Gemmataceae bacterium]